MRMKKLSKVLTSTIALCIIAVLLTACGGSKGDVKTAKEPVPASEAFNQEGIWFYLGNDGIISKDEIISDILVFDGKGNITVYNCSDIKFSDLKELSDDEIITLAKEQDKTSFESDIARLTSSIDKEKTQITEEKEAIVNEMNEVKESEPDKSSEIEEFYGADIDSRQEELDNLDSLLSDVSNLKYKEPEAIPYTIHIETDNSGNNTKIETFTFDIKYLSSSYSKNMTQIENISTEKIELFSDYGLGTVYDMNFRGFGSIVTLVSEDHAGFILDTPDTKGIEVD